MLDSGYGGAGRVYHGWSHVLECLRRLDGIRDRCMQPDVVEFALWFHDAVYDPRASDNERRSADLARTTAETAGLGMPFARTAAGLILATAHTDGPERVEAGGGDGAILADIDLSVLAGDRRAFDAYEAGIRAEYALMPEGEFRAGRRRVLESFLARPRIYATDYFAARLEARARKNLKAALARL